MKEKKEIIKVNDIDWLRGTGVKINKSYLQNYYVVAIGNYYLYYFEIKDKYYCSYKLCNNKENALHFTKDLAKDLAKKLMGDIELV